MRKRLQTRTPTRKHLKGLTEKEAHDRTLKAWVTKHGKYQYHKAHYALHPQVHLMPTPNRYGYHRFQELAEGRPDIHIMDEHEIDAELERQDAELREMGEQASTRSRGPRTTTDPVTGAERTDEGLNIPRPRGVSEGAWVQKMIEERNHVAQYGDFKDPEVRRWMRSGNVSSSERAAFLASVRQGRDFRQRERRVFNEVTTQAEFTPGQVRKGMGGNIHDEDLVSELHRLGQKAWRTKDNKIVIQAKAHQLLDRTDKEYLAHQDVEREVRTQLLPLVNHPKSPEERATPRTPGAPGGIEREPVLGRSSIDEHKVDIAVRNILSRPYAKEALVREPDLRDRLKRTIIRSHTADSETERLAAKYEAERMISRTAQNVGSSWDRQRQVKELKEDEQIFGPGEPPRPPKGRGRGRGGGGGGRKRPTVKRDPVPYDPRVQPTIEEAYAFSGHDEQHFARLKWEAKRAASKAHIGESPEAADKAPWFAESRQQFRFHRRQEQHRQRGIESGMAALGRTENGQLVGVNNRTMKRLAYGVAPNREYEYTLRHPPTDRTAVGQRKPDYIKRVDPFDRSAENTFHVGKRNTLAQIRSGDYDEVVNVKTVKKYNDPVVFNEGDRVFKDKALQRSLERQARDSGIDEVQIIPIHGMEGMKTQDMKTGKVKRHYYQITPNTQQKLPQGTEITAGAWGEGTTTPEGRRGAFIMGDRRWDEVSRAEWEALPTRQQRTRDLPEKARVIFTDPSNVHLAGNSVDQVSVQTPEIHKMVGGQRILGRRVPTKDINLEDRRIILNLRPNTWRERVIGTPIREHARNQFEDRAIKAHKAQSQIQGLEQSYRMMGVAPEDIPQETREQVAKAHGFSGTGELKKFAQAAVMAGVYQSRNRVVKGTVPTVMNKVLNLPRAIPAVDKWAEGHNWNDHVFTVSQAYSRPLQEELHKYGKGIRHPLSSMKEEGDFGIKNISEREWFISDEKRELRRISRSKRTVNRVADMRQYVRQHRSDRGPIGAIRNWRAEPMMDHPDYRHFTEGKHGGKSFLDNHREMYEAYTGTQAGKWAHFHDPVTDKKVSVQVTPQMRGHARSMLEHLDNLERRETGHGALPPRSPHEFHIANHFEGGPGAHPFMVGAGVLGAALAGHYAYHKWQEHKKPKDERVAYYNKILPRAFNVKQPYVHPNSWWTSPDNVVTREFGLQGRKVATRVGYGLKDRTIALRPMDHGIKPNAPIIGGIRSNKKKGGSWGASVLYNEGGLKARQRVGTHDIYVKGHKVATANIGQRQHIKLQSRNPNRFTQEDRDNIVWAFAGTPDEQAVKDFYSYGRRDRIVDMFDDAEEVRRVRHQKGRTSRQRHEHQMYTRFRTGAGI